MQQRYVIGADVGGSHITCCVVDIENRQIMPDSETCVEVDCHWPASKIIATWSHALQQSLSTTDKNICNVGMAIPGPFDYLRGISIMEGVQKYESIFGLDITASLCSAMDRDLDIRYTNDAAAFALGESFCGAAQDLNRVVIFTLGTGLGSGFVADNSLVESGAEVPPNGWVYHLPYEGSIADDRFTTRWFIRRYRELTGKEIAGARQVAELARTDHVAQQIFDEYGKRLADFATPLCRKFHAQTLILGGNISRAIALFRPSFERQVRLLGAHIDLRLSQLHDRATMIGAATLHAIHLPQ